MNRWVDLSHTLTAGAPRRPGTPPPRLETITCQAPPGASFPTSWISFTSHQGTHLDLKGEPTLDRNWGKGWLFDLRNWGPVFTDAELAAADPGSEKDGVFLLWTGLGDTYPEFTHEAMVWLRERAPRAVAVDAGGFAPGARHQARDAVLMDAGILILENVTNLERLPAAGFEVFFFPVVIPGADALPVRVVARYAGDIEKGEEQ